MRKRGVTLVYLLFCPSSSRQLRNPYIISSWAAWRQQLPPSRHYSGIIYIMLHDVLSGNKGITTVTIYTKRLVYSIQQARVLCITFFSSNMAKNLKKAFKSKHTEKKKATIQTKAYKLSQEPSHYDIRGHANAYLKIGPTQVRNLNHKKITHWSAQYLQYLPKRAYFTYLTTGMQYLTKIDYQKIIWKHPFSQLNQN